MSRLRFTLYSFAALLFALTLSCMAQKVAVVNGQKVQQPELPFEYLQLPLSPSTCLGTNAAGLLGGPTGANCPGLASAYDSLVTFGDSICAGTGSTTGGSGGPASTAWCQSLIALWGGGQDWAKGGDMAVDLAGHVYYDITPHVDGNPAVLMTIGVNDFDLWGSSSSSNFVNFQASHLAAMAWAAVPDVAKVLVRPSNPACSFSGTWTSDSERSLTVQNGAFVTCAVTTYGPVLYFSRLAVDSWGGANSTWSMTVDGNVLSGCASGPNNGPGLTSLVSKNGSGSAVVLIRCPLAAGAHTVVLKQNNPTGASGQGFEPIWLGSPGYKPAGAAPLTPPLVFVGDMFPPRGKQTQADTVTWSNLITQDVATLQGDGLNIRFVPIRNFLNNTSDYDGGTLPNGVVCPVAPSQPLHPGDCGHAHLRQAFLSVMGYPHGRFVNAAHPVSFPSGTMTVSSSTPGVAVAFTPGWPNTDARFAVTATITTAVYANTGLFDVHFGAPWVQVVNGADASVPPICNSTPANYAAANVGPLWQNGVSDEAAYHSATATGGIPVGTYIWVFSCQQ